MDPERSRQKGERVPANDSRRRKRPALSTGDQATHLERARRSLGDARRIFRARPQRSPARRGDGRSAKRLIVLADCTRWSGALASAGRSNPDVCSRRWNVREHPLDVGSPGSVPSLEGVSERSCHPVRCFDQTIRRPLHEMAERSLSLIEAVGSEEPGDLLLDADSLELDAAFHVSPACSNPGE